MGSIRTRKSSSKLFIDFRHQGVRCREQTLLEDTLSNRKKLQQLLDRVEAEITLGTFIYENYFPNSSMVERFKVIDRRKEIAKSSCPTFSEFGEVWFSEMEPGWRNSHKKSIEEILSKHLYPEFGKRPMELIKKADILAFRGNLTKQPGLKGRSLSASRINHIMTPLRMILTEAADRYEFTNPFQNIKPLKVPRTDVDPFTLDEVKLILEHVRKDFQPYYCVRFFTGLRTAEIDGLQWDYVDFSRRQILVRQALVQGEMVPTKNDGSYRTVDMSDPVFNALQEQKKATGNSLWVFCNRNGNPLIHNKVTKQVWYPLLRHLNLKKRRPYESRHTAATLWLAAGESPEWIARQMGHSSTEMLFTVYSRYVPNLTRQDGSAFAKLLSQRLPEFVQTDSEGSQS